MKVIDCLQMKAKKIYQRKECRQAVTLMLFYLNSMTLHIQNEPSIKKITEVYTEDEINIVFPACKFTWESKSKTYKNTGVL